MAKKSVVMRVDPAFYNSVSEFQREMNAMLNTKISTIDATRLMSVRQPILLDVQKRKKARYDIRKLV